MIWNKTNPSLLGVLLILLGTNAIAQPYASLFSRGDYGTSWTHKWGNLGQAGIATARYLNDTTIYGITYKKVGLEWSVHPFAGGLFREDTLTGKVWYRDVEMVSPWGSFDTLERLAFDFSLMPGDSFDLSNITGGYPDSLSVVDSVLIINGLKHIYFRAQTRASTVAPKEPVTFIEGVGTNLGILWKHNNKAAGSGATPELFDTYLICSYKNGEKTPYENRAYGGDCNPNVHVDLISSQDGENPGIYLYPQPAKGEVRIANSSGLTIQRIQVMNLFGQVVHRVSGDNLTRLDIGGIFPGLYFIQIFSSQDILTTKQLAIK